MSHSSPMRWALVALAVVLSGCGSTVPDTVPTEAGTDASIDVGVDAGKDVAVDSPSDVITGGDATTVDAGPGTYAAYGIIGGLDRVRIAKTVGSTCFYIQLVSPGSQTGGLTLPSKWGFEFARAVQPAAACNPAYLGPISNSFDASSQSGTISFTANPIPQTIQSVSATLVFANAPVWCPASESFSATNVTVQ